MDFLDEPTVTYRHRDAAANSVRFCQLAKGQLPEWAVDVQPGPTMRESLQTSNDAPIVTYCAPRGSENGWGSLVKILMPGATLDIEYVPKAKLDEAQRYIAQLEGALKGLGKIGFMSVE